MKIRHERPMSDLSFQVRAPLGLELATGDRVTVDQWSLDGFEFPGDSDLLPKEAILCIPFQGVDIRFPVSLKPQPGTRRLSFDGLTGRQRETLSVFYRSILSGKMAATDEIITSLDTPVDLVPMDETEEEKAVATEGKTPRSIRAAASVAIYVALAVLIFWTLGSGIYSKLATVEIRNARIEAAVIDHVAAQSAFVDDILVAPGTEVTAGEVLVRLTTPEGEAALAEVRGRIDLLEDRLETAERREADLAARIERARMDLIRTIETGAAATTQATLDAFDARLSPEHMTLFEAHAAVLRELDTLNEELRRLRRERGRLRDAADALHVMAAEDGIVTGIAVLGGQLVTRGAPVLTLESEAPRQARGWVDQSMAAAFHPGMSVRVRVNTGTGPRDLTGRVSAIEAGIDPDLSPEFGMLVSVSFPEFSAEETRTHLPHLMPVDLRAERAWAADLSDQRAGLFSGAED